MNYYAAPLSRKDIRQIALTFRRYFGAENEPHFDVIWALETIEHWWPGFNYEIVDDSCFEDLRVQAQTDFGAKCVQVRRTVYDRACAGNGRDRMTVAHELGHVVLIEPCCVNLYRRQGEGKLEAFRDPEWQAACFAGELLAPAHLVRGWDASAVAAFCGISRKAAEYQLRKYG